MATATTYGHCDYWCVDADEVCRAIAMVARKAEADVFLRNFFRDPPFEIALSPRAMAMLGPGLARLVGGRVNGVEIELVERPPSSIHIRRVGHADTDLTGDIEVTVRTVSGHYVTHYGSITDGPR